VKTQIIALESHDDLISVKDRMSWAKTPRILLIWPKGEPIALRPLDLKMLQRHARSLGATLGLVTRDSHVRREAAALKLPVFNSPRAAQADLWPVFAFPEFHPSRNAHDLRDLRDAAYMGQARWQVNPIVRIGSFALGVLAVLALSLLFLPHAEIKLSPESKTQSLLIPVVADPSLKSVFITGGVPAHEGTQEVAGTQQILSTGEVAVPESEAKGVARFRNLTSSKIQIPLGTVVLTLGASPIRFVTTQQAEIAAGPGKTVDVPIEAVGAGANGNLEVDLIQVIEGPLGLSLAVTNPAPTSGGTKRMVAAPSAEDRETLREMLMESLRAQVKLELLTDLPLGSVILPDTVRDVVVQEETVDPPAGKTGGTLTLTMRVKFTAQYASGEDLSRLAWLALSASLEDGFSPTTEPPTFHTVGAPVTDETGKTGFQLQMERRIRRAVDVRRVLSLIQGRSMESALARLEESFTFESPPVIKVTPGWWPWLPLAPFRMDVVIQ
jgi:Baseplate J-like protein